MHSRVRCLRTQPIHRYFSSKPDSKSFADTLLLPKTAFPLWSEPSKSEIPFQQKACERLYRWQWDNAKGPLFVSHDGPPYANGHLHMGHALNKILKDIINRYHVLRGDRVHYIPGWDCHGLPIENKALQDLGKNKSELAPTQIRTAARQTALEQVNIQKEEFYRLGIMADWQEPEGKGVYKTLDADYEVRQLRVFGKMLERGLIHRATRPVYYSPSSRSALAEAELTYEDKHVSHSVYVGFELDVADDLGLDLDFGGVRLLVWTTTPWTLSANMGIAVNPDMVYSVLRCEDGRLVIVAKERVEALRHILGDTSLVSDIQGSKLVGISYKPLFSSLIDNVSSMRIMQASHVTPDSGTGLVHMAPAHGQEDYIAFRSLSLLSPSDSSPGMVCHVDGQGKYIPTIAEVVGKEAAESLVGKEVLKAGGKAVVDILKSMDGGVLWGVEKIKHRYPYDWKTNEPVIITATEQWFANLDGVKERAMDVLKDVQFIPEISRNRLQAFIRSRSEWCISRQRHWGVPIPALHHPTTGRVVLDNDSLSHIIGILEEKGRGVEYWWEGDVEEFLPPALSGEEGWEKGTDTMDVWFDSGSSWSLLEGLEGAGNGETRTALADVCLEGSDQHRGWFQSQLLTAVGSSDGAEVKKPYKTLITHGMVLDEKGKKMSKSVGNVVSPMGIINGGKDKRREPAYGADVLRLWVATVEYWRDMSIGPKILGQSAESLRKIRNSARFILGNIGDEESRKGFERVGQAEMGMAERYVMHELYKLEQIALDGYQTYNFAKVINALTNFTNITLSSLYFDITKDCLYADARDSVKRRSVVTVLEQVLHTMTSVMAPVLPHLAEEVHHCAQGGGDDVAATTSVFETQWAPLSEEWYDLKLEEQMKDLLLVRSAVFSLLEKARGKKEVKSSLEAAVDITLPDAGDLATRMLDLLESEGEFLKQLFIVSDVTLETVGDADSQDPCPNPLWTYRDEVVIIENDYNLPIRVRNSTLAKCPRCWTFTRHEEEMLCQRCSKVLDH